MTDEQLAGMLKIDLGIMTAAFDDRLLQYIKTAEESIAEEGATLDLSDIKDAQLVVMYAAWIWRRRDSGDGMPRMLRYALNNRIFSEAMKTDG